MGFFPRTAKTQLTLGLLCIRHYSSCHVYICMIDKISYSWDLHSSKKYRKYLPSFNKAVGEMKKIQ